MAAMEKNNKTLNVPHLRFPEFSGEWKKCMIGDVLKVGNGKDYKHLAEGDIPVFGTGGYMLSVNDFLYEGDSVFIGRKGTINKPFFYSGKFWTVDTLFYTHSFNKVIPHFVYGLFQRVNWNNYNEASGVPSLSKSTIEKIPIAITSIEEQQKISSLLSLLDQRIETHKKIIEDLKKLKDAICDVNFTSGSVLKLGNVGKFVRGLTYSASDVIDDTVGTAVMRSNNISNGDPVNFEELVWVNKIPNHEQILRDGDILICMANGSSPLVGKASYYVDCGMYSATVGAFCGIYRSYNPLTKWLFQSKHYKKHIQRCIQGGNGAIANIYPEDILAISFNIPSGYERVLNTLNSLEDKYLLEQKLLCRYLTVKSHLLAQLFI